MEDIMTDEEEQDYPQAACCPICGWSFEVGSRNPCPHFVTDITEWPPNHAGTDGGAFANLADECLDPLAEAAWAMMLAKGQPLKLAAVPDRVRAVVAALSEWREEYGCEYTPSEEANPVKDAFADYLRAVMIIARPKVESSTYDTNDHYGTIAELFWSPKAGKTAKDMARLVGEDVARLGAAVE
jgi:hypothetical protein